MARKGGQKGSFGRQRLPVSKAYLRPVSRKQGLLFGGLAVLAVLLYYGFDFVASQGRALSNGPLSSSHANLGQDCASCHDAAASVTDEKCGVCHEKFGDELGVFSFKAHYLYRTMDFTRDVPSPNETPCLACHPEHLGRNASLVNVSDNRCIACHAYAPFERNHPQMAFVTENQKDDTTLTFPHIHHVREIMKKKNLEDMEKACLYCHNPTDDGKHFQPISFDEHCDACHLTSSSKTPRLAIRSGDNPIGVETIEAMRARHSAGTLWADFANPAEYRVSGKTLIKSPLHHADPWVMENLRQLRAQLYDDTEMPPVPRGGTRDHRPRPQGFAAIEPGRIQPPRPHSSGPLPRLPFGHSLRRVRQHRRQGAARHRCRLHHQPAVDGDLPKMPRAEFGLGTLHHLS